MDLYYINKCIIDIIHTFCKDVNFYSGIIDSQFF